MAPFCKQLFVINYPVVFWGIATIDISGYYGFLDYENLGS